MPFGNIASPNSGFHIPDPPEILQRAMPRHIPRVLFPGTLLDCFIYGVCYPEGIGYLHNYTHLCYIQRDELAMQSVATRKSNEH